VYEHGCRGADMRSARQSSRCGQVHSRQWRDREESMRSAAETLSLRSRPAAVAVIVFRSIGFAAAGRRSCRGHRVSGQGCVNGTRLLVERPIYEHT